ncbi:hypothetical protein GALMADRAFT_147260 [Galerina marginata CBS 339.88]|uniref:Uncharacterized protein n=1 Tax=Galerina marginata (strain CBS 339.88) TaxID=685588 RepID=A0A067SKE9_GALM3|nr:hypothetical protein GALMADRAFT_147260 [Galerina marginata CBS 339.88]
MELPQTGYWFAGPVRRTEPTVLSQCLPSMVINTGINGDDDVRPATFTDVALPSSSPTRLDPTRAIGSTVDASLCLTPDAVDLALAVAVAAAVTHPPPPLLAITTSLRLLYRHGYDPAALAAVEPRVSCLHRLTHALDLYRRHVRHH